MKSREGYPPQWRLIATRIKQRAGYKCQHCERPHAPPGVILTVHHRDGNKENNNDSNLIALCRRCHLREQAKLQPYIRRKEQEDISQTSFMELTPPYTQPRGGIHKNVTRYFNNLLKNMRDPKDNSSSKC